MKKWRDTSDWIEEYRKPCPDDIAACTARDYERVERQLDELADLTGPESPSVNGLSPRDSAYWSSSTTVNDIEAAVAILLIQRHLTKFGRGPFANPEVGPDAARSPDTTLAGYEHLKRGGSVDLYTNLGCTSRRAPT
jgi:hypothetical protein